MKDKLRELAERLAARIGSQPCISISSKEVCELLSILDAEGDGRAVEVCIPFGEGKVVVTTGTHGGMPCVFLAPASIPGVVGESAARENLPLYKRVSGESILTFPTAEQASIVANTLCGKNTHPTRPVVVSEPPQPARSVSEEPKDHCPYCLGWTGGPLIHCEDGYINKGDLPFITASQAKLVRDFGAIAQEKQS